MHLLRALLIIKMSVFPGDSCEPATASKESLRNLLRTASLLSSYMGSHTAVWTQSMAKEFL